MHEAGKVLADLGVLQVLHSFNVAIKCLLQSTTASVPILLVGTLDFRNKQTNRVLGSCMWQKSQMGSYVLRPLQYTGPKLRIRGQLSSKLGISSV